MNQNILSSRGCWKWGAHLPPSGVFLLSFHLNLKKSHEVFKIGAKCNINKILANECSIRVLYN